jgi:integrase/recombinase XerD
MRYHQTRYYPPKRRPNFNASLDGPPLLVHVIRYYTHCLKQAPQAQATLADWGLSDGALWTAVRLGLCNGTLLDRLPADGDCHRQLREAGLLTEDGQETLSDCLVVPIDHPRHGPTGFYGLPLDGGAVRSVCCRPGGFLNGPMIPTAQRLHIFSSIHGALSAWRAGQHTVTYLDVLPQTQHDLTALLHSFRGSELCFEGFPPPPSPAAWETLVNDLRVQGIRLSRAEDAPPDDTTPSQASLDLNFWQAHLAAAMRAAQSAPRTIEGTMARLKLLFAYLHIQGVRHVAQLTPGHIEGYRSYLLTVQCRGRTISLGTQANQLGTARKFTHFLYKARYLPIDPGAGVDSVRTYPRLLPPALPEADALAMVLSPPVEAPLGLRNRAILELFYGTAIRNPELCRLTVNDIDWRAGNVYIRHAKGQRARIVPLGKQAGESLTAYVQQERPRLSRTPGETTLFLSCRGRAFVHQSMGILVAKLSAQAGLSQRVTPHQFRHACVTHMVRRGAGLRHLQELLGHESLATTQQYLRVEISDLQAMIARFHPREQGVTTP